MLKQYCDLCGDEIKDPVLKGQLKPTEPVQEKGSPKLSLWIRSGDFIASFFSRVEKATEEEDGAIKRAKREVHP